MNVRQQCLLAVLLMATSVLMGCATKPLEDESELQRQAISRWQSCLKRNLVQDSVKGKGSTVNLIHACDGHKRDVLATFPRDLEQRLDNLMLSRARGEMASALQELSVNAEPPKSSQPVSLR